MSVPQWSSTITNTSWMCFWFATCFQSYLIWAKKKVFKSLWSSTAWSQWSLFSSVGTKKIPKSSEMNWWKQSPNDKNLQNEERRVQSVFSLRVPQQMAKLFWSSKEVRSLHYAQFNLALRSTGLRVVSLSARLKLCPCSSTSHASSSCMATQLVNLMKCLFSNQMTISGSTTGTAKRRNGWPLLELCAR